MVFVRVSLSFFVKELIVHVISFFARVHHILMSSTRVHLRRAQMLTGQVMTLYYAIYGVSMGAYILRGHLACSLQNPLRRRPHATFQEVVNTRGEDRAWVEMIRAQWECVSNNPEYG